MSLIEDQNHKNNVEHQEEIKNAWHEHLVELERLRIRDELYKNPAWLKFWERRKKQTQALRDKKRFS
jgi:hypothetical protein